MIDPALRTATEAGLVSASLFRTAQGWQANVKMRGSSGFRVVILDDPVAALLEALTGRRAPAQPPFEDIFG